MDWTNMDIFKGIDLNNSFVLNWSNESKVFKLEIEASIWPESEHYKPPISNEYTCYKKAILKIENYVTISGLLNKTNIKPFIDANHQKDFGNIDSLTKTLQGYKLSGEFGNVEIVGGEVVFEIYT